VWQVSDLLSSQSLEGSFSGICSLRKDNLHLFLVLADILLICNSYQPERLFQRHRRDFGWLYDTVSTDDPPH